MIELINKLKELTTEDNKYLVEHLIKEIKNNNINTEEDLKSLEDKHFMIDNKVLTRLEKIDYCKNSILSSYYDADALDFATAQEYYKLCDKLKVSTNEEEQIELIIRLYSLTGRYQLFSYELYKLIIDKKL